MTWLRRVRTERPTAIYLRSRPVWWFHSFSLASAYRICEEETNYAKSRIFIFNPYNWPSSINNDELWIKYKIKQKYIFIKMFPIACCLVVFYQFWLYRSLNTMYVQFLHLDFVILIKIFQWLHNIYSYCPNILYYLSSINNIMEYCFFWKFSRDDRRRHIFMIEIN